MLKKKIPFPDEVSIDLKDRKKHVVKRKEKPENSVNNLHINEILFSIFKNEPSKGYFSSFITNPTNKHSMKEPAKGATKPSTSSHKRAYPCLAHLYWCGSLSSPESEGSSTTTTSLSHQRTVALDWSIQAQLRYRLCTVKTAITCQGASIGVFVFGSLQSPE